jgi:hypothetical protein
MQCMLSILEGECKCITKGRNPGALVGGRKGINTTTKMLISSMVSGRKGRDPGAMELGRKGRNPITCTAIKC